MFFVDILLVLCWYFVGTLVVLCSYFRVIVDPQGRNREFCVPSRETLSGRLVDVIHLESCVTQRRSVGMPTGTPQRSTSRGRYDGDIAGSRPELTRFSRCVRSIAADPYPWRLSAPRTQGRLAGVNAGVHPYGLTASDPSAAVVRDNRVYTNGRYQSVRCLTPCRSHSTERSIAPTTPRSRTPSSQVTKSTTGSSCSDVARQGRQSPSRAVVPRGTPIRPARTTVYPDWWC
jgi:hypothetical protein